MGTRVINIPANLVKKGDVILHEGKEYPVADVIQLRSSVQINHTKQGYFNLENTQAVEILCNIGTYKELPKVTPVKAGMVVAGETLSYGVNFFYITRVEDYGSDVRLHHKNGYFDFVKSRVVYVVNPGPMSNSPTIELPNQINPVFLPVEEFKTQEVSDEEDVLGKDVEVGDVIWYNANWATVTNAYKHPNSPYNKVNIDYDGVKGLQVRLALTGTYSRKVKAVMETLNIQNAIEAQRILLQKLEQMLDLTQLPPTEDGKMAIGNASIRVDKATVVKAARDEMKAAANKSAELIKKL